MADLTDPSRAFDALIGEIGHLQPDELLEVGHAAIALVVARTRAGQDVNGAQFKPYRKSYARARERASLRTSPPDLVRSGHMLGGMQPLVTGADEITVSFPSDLEATKAAVNNDGCTKLVNVRAHSKNAYLQDVKGKGIIRVSRQAYKKDQRRKGDKRIKAVTENVQQHTRQMNTPAREFLDVKQSREMNFLAEVASEAMARRVNGKIG